ncbi:hypothetical protein T01_10093 [Trichinella spiralis]|uniref:Uncharacterized protein n=1 Tax=Trichinella spiralis TaxID=6334 RepID=A0A0V1B9N0_TRISP|nr:hypothetical protein T01_10093 [Trichinella spiralis]
MDQNVLHLLKVIKKQIHLVYVFLKQFIFKNDAHAIHMVGQFLLDRHDFNGTRITNICVLRIEEYVLCCESS